MHTIRTIKHFYITAHTLGSANLGVEAEVAMDAADVGDAIAFRDWCEEDATATAIDEDGGGLLFRPELEAEAEAIGVPDPLLFVVDIDASSNLTMCSISGCFNAKSVSASHSSPLARRAFCNFPVG